MNELLTLYAMKMIEQFPTNGHNENDEIDLHIRNRAIEILSRKNAPELVSFLLRCYWGNRF